MASSWKYLCAMGPLPERNLHDHAAHLAGEVHVMLGAEIPADGDGISHHPTLGSANLDPDDPFLLLLLLLVASLVRVGAPPADPPDYWLSRKEEGPKKAQALKASLGFSYHTQSEPTFSR